MHLYRRQRGGGYTYVGVYFELDGPSEGVKLLKTIAFGGEKGGKVRYGDGEESAKKVAAATGKAVGDRRRRRRQEQGPGCEAADAEPF